MFFGFRQIHFFECIAGLLELASRFARNRQPNGAYRAAADVRKVPRQTRVVFIDDDGLFWEWFGYWDIDFRIIGLRAGPHRRKGVNGSSGAWGRAMRTAASSSRFRTAALLRIERQGP